MESVSEAGLSLELLEKAGVQACSPAPRQPWLEFLQHILLGEAPD